MSDPLARLRTELRMHAGLVGNSLDERTRAMDLVLLARASPLPGERLLDIGCGAGYLVRDAEACFDGVEAIGIDIERAYNPPVVADARALPFEDESFDIVTAQESLSWIEGLPAVLSEISRVLRGRKILAVGDFAFETKLDDNPWGPVSANTFEGWKGTLSSHGFQIESVTEHSMASMFSYWETKRGLPDRDHSPKYADRHRNLAQRIRAMKDGAVKRLIIVARKT